MNIPTQIFEFERPCPRGTISLPYFTLGAKESVIFHNDTELLKESFMYPDVAECYRVQAFYDSLKAHNYNVNKYDSVKTTNHYCEFSGGGDIYISKGDVSIPLVFVSPTVEELDESDEESSVVGGNVHVSPISHGDSKLASLTIGKKEVVIQRSSNISYGQTWLLLL